MNLRGKEWVETGCDVIPSTNTQTNVATIVFICEFRLFINIDFIELKIECALITNMTGSRCVVQGCSNKQNTKAGISLHNSPLNKTLFEKWKKFVKIHRANFNPEDRFVICSKHFDGSCFSRSEHTEGSMRRLLTGSIPTIWIPVQATNTSSTSARSRRKVSVKCFSLRLFQFMSTHFLHWK
jgi:hypothetical protein